MHRLRRVQGFTLVELLVVILIIGILAAIAIPSFVGQRDKATLAQVRSDLRSAEVAARTYYTDNQTYDGMTVEKLVAIEPTLADASWNSSWCPGPGGRAWGSGDAYCVSMVAPTHPTSLWEIRREDGYRGDDASRRVCAPVGRFACRDLDGRGYGSW